ncbi:MAG: hypothetical protein JWM47_4283, partial [Acidimicrobiales bacterium]|nr:hypothetical protein [Acidimicrobiales bacterium]
MAVTFGQPTRHLGSATPRIATQPLLRRARDRYAGPMRSSTRLTGAGARGTGAVAASADAATSAASIRAVDE